MSTKTLSAVAHARLFEPLNQEQKEKLLAEARNCFIDGKPAEGEKFVEACVKNAIIESHYFEETELVEQHVFSPSEIQETEIECDPYSTFKEIFNEKRQEITEARFYLTCVNGCNTGINSCHDKSHLSWYTAGSLLVFFNDDVENPYSCLIDSKHIMYNFVPYEDGKPSISDLDREFYNFN